MKVQKYFFFHLAVLLFRKLGHATIIPTYQHQGFRQLLMLLQNVSHNDPFIEGSFLNYVSTFVYLMGKQNI